MTQLRGKVVAVTGAGSGLGRALAFALADQGAHVALSDVNATNLAETAELLSARKIDGVRVSTHHVDVRDWDAMQRYANEVEAQHGGADVIINNAGVAVLRHFETLPFEDLRFVLDVNLWGVVHGVRAFLPLMQKRGSGHIVNIGSVNAFLPFPMNAAYTIAKYGVLGLSETLLQELAETTIRVTIVHPGAVKTNLVRNSPGFSQEQVAYFDSVAKTTSDVAARKIVRAIERDKAQILIGKDAWFMWLGKRFAPVWFTRIIGYFMRPKKPALKQ